MINPLLDISNEARKTFVMMMALPGLPYQMENAELRQRGLLVTHPYGLSISRKGYAHYRRLVENGLEIDKHGVIEMGV